jgi:hypothetical protein
MYRNALTPAPLFGTVLLLLAAAGVIMWVGCLLDVDVPAFDGQGWTLLGSTLGALILGSLFLRRARWVRLPTSILLHILALALLATLPFTVPGETLAVQAAIVALTLLAAGLVFLGILALHSEAMRNDLARCPAEHLVKPLHLLAGGGCVLSLAAVGVWQMMPLLTAKPVVTGDYLSKMNRANRPARYDASRNAAPLYEKFFAEFTPLPEVLTPVWSAWPTDLNAEEQQALEEWAPVTESALTTFAQATQSPYWWYEFKRGEDPLAVNADLERVRACTWSIVLLAKYRASRGEADSALRLLTDLHMCGVHQIKNGVFVTQMAGLAVCEVAYDAVLAILGRCAVTPDALRQTLNAFAARLPQIDMPRFSEIERARGRDAIQQMFTNDNRGSGRLIPAQLYQYKKRHLTFYRSPLPYLDAVWTCLMHPSRQQTILLFEEYFTTVGRLARQTPWELHAQNTSYEQRVTGLLSRNYFLQDTLGSMGRCIRIGWRARVAGQGTIATLAVLVYRAQEDRLPESLQQVVDAGLLAGIPLDPYSGRPYVYRVTGDRFRLYSVGEDFVDDGGLRCDWDEKAGGDRVFWPRQDTDADLVEWLREKVRAGGVCRENLSIRQEQNEAMAYSREDEPVVD